MNKILYILIGLSLVLLSGCEDIDSAYKVKSSSNKLTTLLATFADGTGGFSPVESEPYPDDITIKVPWYYPEGTYNETKLDSMFLTATLPNSSYMKPAFGLVNMTQPVTFRLTAQNGDVQNYSITAVRTRSSKCEVKSFKLNEADIDAVIVGNKIIIPFTTTDLSSQTATFSLSYYATISPDPATVHNYNNPVEYTVTADDGTQAVYTVQMGAVVKVAQGFAQSKVLWTKSAGDLSFDDYAQISMAVSGDYLVLPTSNEWTSGSTIKYYNRKTGSYAGTMDVTGANGIYSVASDTNGVIVGINNLYASEYVRLFTWDNVTSSPVSLATSTSWTCVASSFYGRKLSVYGDLKKDAVIMSTTDGTNGGGGPNYVLRWTVKNGAVVSQDPEFILYSSAYGYVAKAVPVGNESTSNYFLCSNYSSFIDYVNGSTNNIITSFSSGWLEAPRGATPALTYFEFNNAKYAAVIDASAYSSAMHIFNVTSSSRISTSYSDSYYSTFHALNGESDYIACPSANWNITGEVAVSPVSADRYTIDVYFLCTNGGILAYQLSCVDPTAIGK
jgi:hypothetical protein